MLELLGRTRVRFHPAPQRDSPPMSHPMPFGVVEKSRDIPHRVGGRVWVPVRDVREVAA
jgi:hypothetical protein